MCGTRLLFLCSARGFRGELRLLGSLERSVVGEALLFLCPSGGGLGLRLRGAGFNPRGFGLCPFARRLLARRVDASGDARQGQRQEDGGRDDGRAAESLVAASVLERLLDAADDVGGG